ncbi:SGNH hydrolase domain-containing protein [Paractinoplanes globisporus]|uniref:SGNH hydrolase domain-containing protein n=1 Tax=Paractinoplanes globisporus TaxID=113565 RepID=A0ABW6WT23_9ACTN|nr:SGNH hydrolase domain-containing protein [Actinoplanes globisporus]
MCSIDSRTRRLPVLVLVLALLTACSEGNAAPRPADRPAPRVALAGVLAAVRKAPTIHTVPADLTPSLATAGDDLGFDNTKCEVAPAADRIAQPCVFGDPASAVRVVLYGDSHAGMWLPAMKEIAERRHWRLDFYGKPACPTPALSYWNQQESRPFPECDRFRDFVLGQVRLTRPELVVVTNESFSQKLGRGVLITPGQWRDGLIKTLGTLSRSATRVVVLGDTPVLDQSAPDCLAAHGSNVPSCFTTRAKATARVWNAADQAAARATGAGYISVLPWLCTTTCTPVVGNVMVYRNRYHLTGTYSRMLNGVLEDALDSLSAV